jgi:hypothetical protein
MLRVWMNIMLSKMWMYMLSEMQISMLLRCRFVLLTIMRKKGEPVSDP